MKVAYFIFASILIAISFYVIPAVKDASALIFEELDIIVTESSPFMQLMIALWPLWLIILFIFSIVIVLKKHKEE